MIPFHSKSLDSVTLVGVASLSGRRTKMNYDVGFLWRTKTSKFPSVLHLDQIGRLIIPDAQASLGVRSFLMVFLTSFPLPYFEAFASRWSLTYHFIFAVSLVHFKSASSLLLMKVYD